MVSKIVGFKSHTNVDHSAVEVKIKQCIRMLISQDITEIFSMPFE